MSRGSFVDPTADITDNIFVTIKILLVYEEYSEMMSTQATLQKVGFDVLAISTEYTLSENVLSFNPDIVVAFGRGGKVTTLGVGRRLREMTRWQGKAVLILPSGYKPNPQDFGKIRADMLLEAPVPVLRLLQVLSKMLGLDEAAVLDRLHRHNLENPSGAHPDEVIPTGAPNAVTAEESRMVAGGAAADEELAKLLASARETETKKMSFTTEPQGEESRSVSMDFSTKPKKEKEQDLESLWKELTEGPDLQKVTGAAEESTSQTVAGAPQGMSFTLPEREKALDVSEVDLVAKDLQNARKTERERIAKYARFELSDFDSSQGLSKIASRKVQKDITTAWNHEEIENQDKARQEFTKALFRKK